MNDKPCPYMQGDLTHWCLLAEKGKPLTNEQISQKMGTLGEDWTPTERAAFYAGVRWAERAHGVTG